MNYDGGAWRTSFGVGIADADYTAGFEGRFLKVEALAIGPRRVVILAQMHRLFGLPTKRERPELKNSPAKRLEGEKACEGSYQ